jgi:hypothetical protein
MSLSYTVRPISDRTWLGQSRREPTRFQSKWSDTLDLLQREVEALKGRDVVIEIDVVEADLRLDGTLRANARPSSDAVALAFESKHGSLFYRCDRFFTSWSHQGPAWQHNVRAIALTLQALRAVDRYGATETGQQYAGWKALPAGTAMPASHMTSDAATELLRSYAPAGVPLKDAWRAARAATHPDRNDGVREAWDRVETAAAVMGIAS